MDYLLELGREFGVVVMLLVSIMFAVWKSVSWLGDRLVGDNGLLTKLLEQHLATLAEFREQMTTMTDLQKRILEELRGFPCRHNWDGETERRAGDERRSSG